MIRLLNSAMMPAEGVYRLQRITRAEFSFWMRQAARTGFTSTVGYQETAHHIEAVSGVKVPVSRDPTVLEDGDVLLICKLKYRATEPGRKGAPVGSEAFEYFQCEYRST